MRDIVQIKVALFLQAYRISDNFADCTEGNEDLLVWPELEDALSLFFGERPSHSVQGMHVQRVSLVQGLDHLVKVLGGRVVWGAYFQPRNVFLVPRVLYLTHDLVPVLSSFFCKHGNPTFHETTDSRERTPVIPRMYRYQYSFPPLDLGDLESGLIVEPANVELVEEALEVFFVGRVLVPENELHVVEALLKHLLHVDERASKRCRRSLLDASHLHKISPWLHAEEYSFVRSVLSNSKDKVICNETRRDDKIGFFLEH